ncbi:WD40 repeat domain-containing protein [Microcoleus sp. K1-B6]|uniref:WD40 repeat domain-containing protein n=1 Tax=unclassified Microcoleus TaxID=2642155 RepID=UPI002FD31237
MSAFREEDKDLFFGREEFVEKLVEAVKQHSLVPVIGASGSGKSSVVLAGLIPRLQAEETWLIASFRPQNQPFYGLASALVRVRYPELQKDEQDKETSKRFDLMKDLKLWQLVINILEENPGKQLLLVIDQFEELYALDSEEQQQFVDALLEAIKENPIRFKLVLTIRTDFLDRIMMYPRFKEAALQQESHKFLGAMNREEMRSVIELVDRPTQKKIVELEEGLTERILDDVQQEPGSLPLLEFALTQLWKENKGGTLTFQTYEKIGGVKKVLANHADKIYDRLNEEEKQQAQQIFLQLARPGEMLEDITVAVDTRRLATRAEIGESNWNLVQKLASSDPDKPDKERQLPLLVTGRNDRTGDQTVEVVHEALIREWEKLQQWIDDDRAFLTWRHQLWAQMEIWNYGDRDQGDLLRGRPLVIAEDWLQKRRSELINEQEYIEQSLKLHKQKQQKQKHIRWGIFSVLMGFLGIAGGLWWHAESQKQKVENSQSQLRINYSAALFNQGQNFDALMAALQVAKPLPSEPKPPIEVVEGLRQAVYGVIERNRLEGHSNWVNGVSFSPDGKTLASGSGDNTIKLWNVDTGQVISTIEAHNSPITSVSFSPDGKTLASGSADNTIKLWNVQTSKVITTLNKHSKGLRSISFSRDGILASGSDDSTIKLWDVKTGKVIHTLKGHKNIVYSISFSPDGKILASGSADKTIKLWNVKTGKEEKSLPEHENAVLSVSFSRDGALASGSADNTIKLWDIKTGKVIHTLKEHKNSVFSVSFSADGKTLASGSDDNTIRLWDVKTGERTTIFTEHNNTVRSLSFSPDGKTLASGSGDNSIKLWNISSGKEQTFKGHQDSIFSVSFSPDGKTLASASPDKTIKLWDLTTGKQKPLKGKEHSKFVRSVSFSPDGKVLASGSDDQTIKLWNIDKDKGELIRTIEDAHSKPIYSVSFGADSKTLASGSEDKTIKIWDLDTDKQTILKEHDKTVRSVSFSPDGKTLASGSDDSTIKLWDVNTTGKSKNTLTGHDNWVSSVSFSPDGKTLASGSADKSIILWDVGVDKPIIKNIFTEVSTVYGVSFSPDGKTLAYGTDDPGVKLWDLNTGNIITLDGHTNGVYSISFSPDGKTLASGSGDATVILWNLDFDDLLVRSCNWVRPYLQNNLNVSEDDKKLCDGIDTKQK